MKLFYIIILFNYYYISFIFSLLLNKLQIKNEIFQLLLSDSSDSKLLELYKEHKQIKLQQQEQQEGNKQEYLSKLDILLSSIHIDIITNKPENKTIKHVLQILTDDQGWADIGYNDNTFLTPTIDFLANHGIKLNNFYTHCTCTPARASLITGRYAIKTGLQDGPVVPGERRNLPVGLKTMPEYFKEAGYRTLLIGKWHLGQEFRNMTPNERGYDYFFGNLGGAIDHYSKDIGVGCGTKENDYHDVFSDKCKYFNAYDFQENGIPYFDQERFDIDILAEKSKNAILEHNTSIPLFFSFHPNVPHAPVISPQVYIDLCEGVSKGSPRSIQPYFRQRICGMVTSIDFAILKIIFSLYIKDMLSSTLIFYLSDNGGFLEAGSSNYPYREGKGSLYEGGIHVPAFMYGHGIQSHYSTNKNHTDLFHISDVLPTLLGYAGIYPSSTLPSSTKLLSHFDGYNHWDNLVLGKPLTRTRIPINAASIAVGLYSGFIQKAFGKTWKYMFNPNVLIYSGLNPPAHHAPKYRIEGEFLYDLTNDPFETTNLIPYINHFTNTNLQTLEVLNLIRFELLAFRSTGIASQLKRLPVDIVIRPTITGCWLPLNSQYRDNITCPVPTPITPDNVFAEYDIPSLVRPLDPSVTNSLSLPTVDDSIQTVGIEGTIL